MHVSSLSYKAFPGGSACLGRCVQCIDANKLSQSVHRLAQRELLTALSTASSFEEFPRWVNISNILSACSEDIIVL